MDDDLANAMEKETARAMGMPLVASPQSEASSPDSEAKSSDFELKRKAMLLIRTPVTVTLARKQESLHRILDLIPGSMLTFDTHCDEPLTLEAGGHPIATGETIKIGDKFGLRIREILDCAKED